MTVETNKPPLCSIGITVFNAERFLEETLQALLNQDYGNLEFVISDNASTDGSSLICKRYADQDPRIRYFRNSKNMGSVWNWNNALSLSQGEYFMWASDHDLWDPGYVRKCIAVLIDDPNCVLCYSQARRLDINGNPREELHARVDTAHRWAPHRFRNTLWNLKQCHMIHGVQRTRLSKGLGGFPNAWAMDMAYLTALSLHGKFVQLEEILYFRRDNRPRPEDLPEDVRQFHIAQLDPTRAESRAGQDKSGHYRETRNAVLALLWRSNFSLLLRLYCSAMTLACYWSRYGVGFGGLEHFVRLLPKALRRNSLLRPETRKGAP